MAGELGMMIGDTLASSGMESALELALKYIKDCVSKRNLKLGYREFITSLLKFKNIESQDIDNIVKLLKAVNGNSNIDLLKHKLTENLSTYFTNRKDAEEYAYLILQFLAEVNPKARKTIDDFLEKERRSIAERQSDINKAKETISFLGYFRKIISEELTRYKNDDTDWYFTISEVGNNLVGLTGGIVDLSFFNSFDAIFENNLKSLIDEGECRCIEVFSSDWKEAFYYVLYILDSAGYSDRVKIIRSPEVWESIMKYSSDDILVAGFEDTSEISIKAGVINIKIHGRFSFKDKNRDNYLTLKEPSSYFMETALYHIFDDSKETERLFETTGGIFSLVLADIISEHQDDAAWRTVMNDRKKRKALEDFVIINSFSASDYSLLESLGFNPDDILDTIKEVDNLVKYPVYIKKYDRYKIVSPETLWAACLHYDEDFCSYFINEGIRILKDRNVTEELAVNIIYTYILHRDKTSRIISNDKFFNEIAYDFLASGNRGKIKSALTELSPCLMLKWFENNPKEINDDDNFNALALLMHDETYSYKMAELLCCNFDGRTGYSYSVSSLLEEFLRPLVNTSGLSADEVIGILKKAGNARNLMASVLAVLYREYSCFSLVHEYYKYSKSYAEDMRERKEDEYTRLENFEIKWYLEHAEVKDIIQFLEQIDFMYFDFEEALYSALEKVLKTITEEDHIRLYMALFDVYYKHYFSKRIYVPGKLEKLKSCFNLATPEDAIKRVLPLFQKHVRQFRYSTYSGEGSVHAEYGKYSMEVIPIVRSEGVKLEEYLKIPELLNDDIDATVYIECLFELYPKDVLSYEVFRTLPDSCAHNYVDAVNKNFSKEEIVTFFDSLDDDSKYRFIGNGLYVNIKDMLSSLPPELEEKYWDERQDFNLLGLDKDDATVCLHRLLERGKYLIVARMLCFNQPEFTAGELCHFVADMKNPDRDPVISGYLTKTFEKIRVYSDEGNIAFETVLSWEENLLTMNEILEKDSFFIRDFKNSPDIMCKLQSIIFKKDDGEGNGEGKKLYNNMDTYRLFFQIEVCPGVDNNYNVDEEKLSEWVKSYIAKMESQKQKNIIPIGLARIFSCSILSFDSILPDQICRILDRLDRAYRDNVVRELVSAISNRQGGYWDNGRVSGDVSFLFKSYSKRMEENGFHTASNLYTFLAKCYESRDEYEREN